MYASVLTKNQQCSAMLSTMLSAMLSAILSTMLQNALSKAESYIAMLRNAEQCGAMLNNAKIQKLRQLKARKSGS